MSAFPQRRTARVVAGALIAIAAALLAFAPVAAQSTASQSPDSPAWRITAAILLVAFIAGVIALFLTRWRRLFIGAKP